MLDQTGSFCICYCYRQLNYGGKMELQLALDFTTIPDAKKMVHELEPMIDILEIGTPFIIQEGLFAVRELRKDFQNLKIFADLKIMDAGEHETEKAIEAGADIVSVLGAADNATINAVISTAHKRNKFVLVDMIAVHDVSTRAAEVNSLGADYICVHTAFDTQEANNTPLPKLQMINNIIKNTKIAVAGGIKLDTLPEIVKYNPAIIIVGSGITSQPDKYNTALQIKEIIKHGK